MGMRRCHCCESSWCLSCRTSKRRDRRRACQKISYSPYISLAKDTEKEELAWCGDVPSRS
jgi:hypothetical protein